MDADERITAAARARWGYRDVDIALSTIIRTWHTRAGDAKRSHTSFRFGYQLLTPVKFAAEVREFASADERLSFINAGISDWTDRRSSRHVLPAWSPVMRTWVGAKVDAAEIDETETLVLELHGQPYRLELLPELRTKGGSIGESSPDYRSALRSLVGRKVQRVDVYLDDGLVVEFGDAELVLTTARIWADPWQGEVEWAIGGYTIPPEPGPPHVTFPNAD
jgi:hypothetical protein